MSTCETRYDCSETVCMKGVTPESDFSEFIGDKVCDVGINIRYSDGSVKDFPLFSLNCPEFEYDGYDCVTQNRELAAADEKWKWWTRCNNCNEKWKWGVNKKYIL